MKQVRTGRGAATPLVIALAVVVVLIGVGFVVYSLYMGGSKEVQNAADAGMLNVCKKIVDGVTVNLDDVPMDAKTRTLFSGVAAKGPGGKPVVNLRTLNSIWYIALKVGMNAESLAKQGLDDHAVENARAVADAAQAITDKLEAKLKDQSNLQPYFDQMFTQNSTRMANAGPNKSTVVAKPESLDKSFLGKGQSSNVALGNLPDGLDGTDLEGFGSGGPSEGTSIPGYKKLHLQRVARDYFYVPFTPGKMPHLVNVGPFASNKNADFDPTHKYEVPNGFALVAATTTNGITQEQVTQGQANLSTGGDATTPGARGFVKVINDIGITFQWPDLHVVEYANAQLLWIRSGQMANLGQDFATMLMYYPATIAQNDMQQNVRTQDNAHFVYGFAPCVERIIKANLDGKTPDCSCLVHPLPATTACKDIKGGVVVTNNDIAPGQEPGHRLYVDETGGGSEAGYGTVEQFQLQSNYPPSPTGVVFSGQKHVPTTREPIPQGQAPRFTTDATLAEILGISEFADVRSRIKLAAAQIFNGKLNDSEFSELLASKAIPLGAKAYIYEGDNKKLTIKLETDGLPEWLEAIKDTEPDGKVLPPFYGPKHRITSTAYGTDILNHAEDWGFPSPYDVPTPVCYMDRVKYQPASGSEGIFGLCTLQSFLNACCDSAHPEDCPCSGDTCAHTGPC